MEVGEILSKVLNVHITAETLPDGKMYFNIADRVLNETLKNNYSLVSDYTEGVQTRLNRQAGLKLRAQRPDFDQDRVKGFVNKLSSADDFTDVQWVLGDPMVNFTQSVVDEAIKKNAKFHSDAGMKSVIKRQVKGKACKWCRGLEGTYDYPKGTPNEVFHRHENCRCVTEYYPSGKKKKQDVWSKDWSDRKSERRKDQLQGLNNDFTASKKNRSKPLEMLAHTEAEKLGYSPLPTAKVINEMRTQGRKWKKSLTEEEIRSINKYTFNGTDPDGKKLYFKINEYAEGRYKPKSLKELEILFRNAGNIDSGIEKFELKNDIIVFRNDSYAAHLSGENKKFISTSVVPSATLGSKANVAIIVPKGSNGAYVELLAESRYKKQREFIINRYSDFKLVTKMNEMYIYELR
ncbi:ADP-ribosyltransferase [Ligilactobacillus saerimneri]|uniref:ADP-ribosyltransferase n=1 Tax=Ligilactobacillus saerimneri TaxID=228229 RepID=UPI002942EDED|nr:ADP-ribosyltransferase [Ligilactobacillus saerimneri]